MRGPWLLLVGAWLGVGLSGSAYAAPVPTPVNAARQDRAKVRELISKLRGVKDGDLYVGAANVVSITLHSGVEVLVQLLKSGSQINQLCVLGRVGSGDDALLHLNAKERHEALGFIAAALPTRNQQVMVSVFPRASAPAKASFAVAFESTSHAARNYLALKNAGVPFL